MDLKQKKRIGAKHPVRFLTFYPNGQATEPVFFSEVPLIPLLKKVMNIILYHVSIRDVVNRNEERNVRR